MKSLFAVTMVAMLMFAAFVPGVSASEICSTESVSCASLTNASNRGVADLKAAEAAAVRRANEASAARYTGLAAYYSARAAWGLRTQAARMQALADYYANLPWATATMARSRGVAGLYGR